jgi:RimJ/RimL family protein N-acetyltransferase
LIHGVFPLNREDQYRIIESGLNNKSGLLLSIIDNKTDKMIGVVSLKSIDLINGVAEIAIVMGFDKVPGAAIEAMALLTQHAFDRLNLNKLYAGQHMALWKWVNTLETIGYKLEGYRTNFGVRDGESYDIVLTGIDKENYYRLKAERGGKLIHNFDQLYQLKRKENIFPKLAQFLKELNNSR